MTLSTPDIPARRLRLQIVALAAVWMAATTPHAQDGARSSAECREQVRQLCGSASEPLRECLARRRDELPKACLDDLMARARANMARRAHENRPRLEAQAAALGAVEHAYGDDPAQKLDIYRATTQAPAPIFVFVHGGGWSRGDKRNATGFEKVQHLQALGWHVASLDYRLVPRATVEQQATDVARAVAWLRKQAGTLGIDTQRMVLGGHSAGAHLSALVGTDEQYLAAAGLGFRALAGVVPIDGAAYDIPAQRQGGMRIMQETYSKAFGDDPARQKLLSPTLRASAPGMPAFLILHVDRADAVRQSAGLAEALRRAGARVQLENVGGSGARAHGDINRRLGEPGYKATQVLDAWLATVIAAGPPR